MGDIACSFEPREPILLTFIGGRFSHTPSAPSERLKVSLVVERGTTGFKASLEQTSHVFLEGCAAEVGQGEQSGNSNTWIWEGRAKCWTLPVTGSTSTQKVEPVTQFRATLYLKRDRRSVDI